MNLFKKLGVLLLAGSMVFNVQLPAFAADKGPSLTDDVDDETDGISSLIFKSDSNIYALFADHKVKTSKVSGASYDLKTNTLTLKKVKRDNLVLRATSMGDDFKIKVVGACSLKGIEVFADRYGASVNITGSGKLVVNSAKELDYGIYSYGAKTYSPKVRVGKKVKLTVSGKAGAIACVAMKDKGLSDAIKFDNGLELELETGKYMARSVAEASYYFTDNTKKVKGLLIDGSSYANDDGKTIYLASETKVEDSLGNKVDGIRIDAYKEIADMQVYEINDNFYYDLGGKTSYGYVEMTLEEFDNQTDFSYALQDGSQIIMEYDVAEGEGSLRNLIVDVNENYYVKASDNSGYYKALNVVYGEEEDGEILIYCFVKEKTKYQYEELVGAQNGGDEYAFGYKYVYEGKKLTVKPVSHKKTTIKSVKGAKKSFTVKWKKVSSGIKGYQIQYSTNKKFKKGNKTVLVTKKGTTSKKIKKLKSGKTYYVRVRTYKMMSGQKCFSGWSKKVSVITK